MHCKPSQADVCILFRLQAFADVVASVTGDNGNVVAVTNAEKAAAVSAAKPDYWTVKQVL